MTVSVTQTTEGTNLTWDRRDDQHGYIAQAVTSGRLEAALTALGLPSYADIATLDEYERAEILRGTAALAADLGRRVRSLTVACREGGMTWGTLASTLTGDATQRSTARSTYEAGVRQLGTGHLPMTTYAWTADATSEDQQGGTITATLTGTVAAVSDQAARRDAETRLTAQGWQVTAMTLTPTQD